MIFDPNSPHPHGRYRHVATRPYRVELHAVVVMAAASEAEAVEAVTKATLVNSQLCFAESSVKVKEEAS